MNTLFRKIAVTVNLALSLGLLSCQENSVVTPDKPVNASSPAVNDIILPGAPKKYTLIKSQAANLTYYTDGRLKRVEGPDAQYSRKYYRDYTYTGNSIQAITYIDGKLAIKDTYLIDPATGRCYESEQVDYFVLKTPIYLNLEVDPSATRTWKYTYNSLGQLESCALKINPATRTEYTYNNQGDMTRAGAYYYGISQMGQEWYNVSFTYVPQPTSTRSNPGQIKVIEYVADPHPLNFNWINLPDPEYSIDYYSQPIPERYLRIFGMSSKHLMASASWHVDGYGIHNYDFTYTLNADGYVTERKKYDKSNTQLLETRPYEYLVTNIGIGAQF